MKIDLRVAKVLTAERVPKSKKLVKLHRRCRHRAAHARRRHRRGLRARGARRPPVVIVANLKPATLMGIESNGMVLAGSRRRQARALVSFGDAGRQPGSDVRRSRRLRGAARYDVR